MANETKPWTKGFSERILSERWEGRKEQSHVGTDVKDFELSFVREH